MESGPEVKSTENVSMDSDPNTERACIICGGAEIKPFNDAVSQCRACGYIFAETKLTESEIAALYEEHLFTGGAFSDYLADEKFLRKNFANRLRVLDRFLDPKRHRNLIEIGSAYGIFLDMARDKFASVRGMDVTDAGVKYAKERFKLNVEQANFLAHDFGSEKFDVVCMWDTIEHLNAPQLFLEKIAAHSESGALLALTTGDIGSLNARLRKDKWRLMIPPLHLHYFTRASLTKLLARHGFEVVYLRRCGFHRSIDFAAYNVFVLRQKQRWLYQLMRKSGLTKFGFYLNLYDIIYVVARRR
jgi:2-polyprenyl-3-methyl-5-hydroxy-6-metoxy-1,4-benzoquinol methylase